MEDQALVKCPKCGENIIVNESRDVFELKDRINKAIEYIERHNIYVGRLYYKYNKKYLISKIKEDLLKILKG